MNRFAYARAETWSQARDLLGDRRFSLPVLKGGGLDLVDQMKEGILEPDLLVDVRGAGAVGEDGQRRGEQPEPIRMSDRWGRPLVSITPSATLAEIAASPLVRERAAALAQAAESAATPQVRNVATIAGNLLQRPRCWYFRHDEFNCLKKGGSTCFAVDGENAYHAIFGGGPCHIVHPSNVACAMAALGGYVDGFGVPDEARSIEGLFHLPDQGVRTEHNLPAGAVLTHIGVEPWAVSGFHAIKAKQSFDWPLAMAAVGLRVEGGRIASARVCAGAVAPVPWMLPDVAGALVGVSTDDDLAIERACAGAAQGAAPMSQNGYKARLLPVAVQRAVLRALGRLAEELA
ncbi:MAG: FAD binding domain-containing protein [Phycisphaerales bacterium]